MFEDEGRKCRNIGRVECEEVGGRNGGQGRTHSVEVCRNGGIAGISGRRDDFGREIVEIKEQRVLGDVGQELADGKRLIERVFETRFSVSRSAMSSSTHFIDPLIHDIHNIHDSSIAGNVFHDKSIDEDRLHGNRVAESRVAGTDAID